MLDLPDIFFRAATAQDYVACRRLTNQAGNREGFGFVSRVTFEDFCIRQPIDPRYLVRAAIDDNNKIIGYIRALRLRNNQQITIHEICRDQHHKGTGVGQLLLHDIQAIAQANATPRLFLKAPFGIAAQRAYTRFGFVEIGYEITRTGRKLCHLSKTL